MVFFSMLNTELNTGRAATPVTPMPTWPPAAQVYPLPKLVPDNQWPLDTEWESTVSAVRCVCIPPTPLMITDNGGWVAMDTQ
eukprot:NODE_6672_length_349_cov_8.370000_g5946_i0.p1 GENE.NODE_6672_length_349_cov_8.370000_g5946_i0~~NODE_6672_length_349_cov_8.370000_g5946_i0.p1  ORF type:complete len:82 (+),score=9.39 NODE_6672_length_349_cov_8.370000_g5946_i0:67-312(+)